jgi:hypothetical protein
LHATKDKSVIYFIMGPLYAMRQPFQDMVGISAKNFSDVI